MSKNDDEDKQAFIEAMAHVVRLPHTKKERSVLGTKTRHKTALTSPSQSSSTLTPRQKTATSRLKPQSPLDSPRPTVVCPQPYQPEVYAEDILSYQDASINKTSWQQFRSGKYQLDMRLDLHGLTLIEAEHALEMLMRRAQENGAQHLLIIHGKGSHDGNTPPVLKNWLWRWLRNCPRVLAIHSAPKHQGGAGAVLVWLKKK